MREYALRRVAQIPGHTGLPSKVELVGRFLRVPPQGCREHGKKQYERQNRFSHRKECGEGGILIHAYCNGLNRRAFMAPTR